MNTGGKGDAFWRLNTQYTNYVWPGFENWCKFQSTFYEVVYAQSTVLVIFCFFHLFNELFDCAIK